LEVAVRTEVVAQMTATIAINNNIGTYLR